MKNGDLSIVFPVLGTGGSPTGPGPGSRVVIKTLEAQVDEFLLGCKYPLILRVDSVALWKIIIEEDAVLIPKNRGENFSSGFLHLESLWAG